MSILTLKAKKPPARPPSANANASITFLLMVPTISNAYANTLTKNTTSELENAPVKNVQTAMGSQVHGLAPVVPNLLIMLPLSKRTNKEKLKVNR